MIAWPRWPAFRWTFSPASSWRCWTERIRQVDDLDDDRRLRDADRRRHRHRRKSVVAMPPYRRNIGMVFQNYALFPHLTAADNIGFPLKQRGRRQGRAGRAGPRGAGADAIASTMVSPTRANCPVASNSGSLSRAHRVQAAPSSDGRTLGRARQAAAARTCSWRCAAFMPILASPSSMSPTTRRRLSPCRTVSPL